MRPSLMCPSLAVPADDSGMCEVCGGRDCQCPDCPTCGEAGRPNCYAEHGMPFLDEQLIRRCHMLEEMLEWVAFTDEAYAAGAD